MARNRRLVVALATLCCAATTASGAAAASLTPAEAGLLQAVNATRAAHALQPLSLDPTLTRAARVHSTEMMRDDYFAHGNFTERMLAFHVQGQYVGENLAWASGSYWSADTMISEWLHSPRHRANLLRPGYTRIGIGTSQGSFLGNGGSTVVTADFAGS